MSCTRINPFWRWLASAVLLVAGWYLFGEQARRALRPAPNAGEDSTIDATRSGDNGQRIAGQVTYVFDGDTLQIRTETGQTSRLRLAGIDAPEQGQAFGDQARQRLAQLCGDQRITARVVDRDRYGRWVVDVYVDETWVNLRMVADGLAWHDRRYSDSAELARQQHAARSASRGLWRDQPALPPWEFRHAKP